MLRSVRWSPSRMASALCAALASSRWYRGTTYGDRTHNIAAIERICSAQPFSPAATSIRAIMGFTGSSARLSPIPGVRRP
eukprot:829765-Amorphochlora_amoeboformis.AAC.1